jgi:glyoxylase-like metal-dependent hydrolase (beta-lactamase superfamily II)
MSELSVIKMQLGYIEIHLLSDGLMWLDGGGAFGLVPRVKWESILPPDELNRVPLDLRCLLIHSDGKLIIVDTGLGNKLNEKQRHLFGLKRPNGGLIQALARLDISPEAIDIVINTHLHADHCGGNTCLQNGHIVPTFVNAEYWVQRLEWTDATLPNERTRATYFAQNFVPLQETGQLRLLDGDEQVTSNVQVVLTRGHTRAHQSVIIESGGKTVFYTGDLATLAVHFERLAWVTAYDVEPLETIATKRQWQAWAIERDALIIPAHDRQMPLARFQRINGELRLRAASTPFHK